MSTSGDITNRFGLPACSVWFPGKFLVTGKHVSAVTIPAYCESLCMTGLHSEKFPSLLINHYLPRHDETCDTPRSYPVFI